MTMGRKNKNKVQNSGRLRINIKKRDGFAYYVESGMLYREKEGGNYRQKLDNRTLDIVLEKGWIYFVNDTHYGCSVRRMRMLDGSENKQLDQCDCRTSIRVSGEYIYYKKFGNNYVMCKEGTDKKRYDESAVKLEAVDERNGLNESDNVIDGPMPDDKLILEKPHEIKVIISPDPIIDDITGQKISFESKLIESALIVTEKGISCKDVEGLRELSKQSGKIELSQIYDDSGTFLRFSMAMQNRNSFTKKLGDINAAAVAEIILFAHLGKFSSETWSEENKNLIQQIISAKNAYDDALTAFGNVCLPKEVKNKITYETIRIADFLVEKKMCEPLNGADISEMLKVEISYTLLGMKNRGLKKLQIAAEKPMFQCEMTVSSHKEKQFGYSISCRGLTHMEMGTPCDDSSGVYFHDTANVTYGFVADGVGSQPISRIGAAMAGKAFCHIIEKYISTNEDIDSNIAEYFVNEFKDVFSNAWREKLLQYIIENVTTDEEKAKLCADGVLKNEDALEIKSYSSFGTTFLGIIRTPKYVICFKIGDGEFILSDGISGNSLIEINDNNTIKNSTASLHNMSENENLSCIRIFRSENIQSAVLCSDGAAFLSYKFINDVPMYRDISSMFDFIEKVREKDLCEKETFIKSLAEMFACGPQSKGSRQDDTSIVYFEWPFKVNDQTSKTDDNPMK